MGDMRMERAVVLSQEEIAPDIYSLGVEARAAEAARPGQFVALSTEDGCKLLPRPISLCQIRSREGRLRLVYRVTGPGTGTELFSRLEPGREIPLLGPLGNGFPLEAAEGKRVLLAGGGIGIPPMIALGEALGERGITPTSVMGYRDRVFLERELSGLGPLFIATQDGSQGIPGNVLDAIRREGLEADLLYACGPKPMLGALKAYGQERDLPVYLSLEERMACGIGACLACVCKTTGTDSHTHVKNARVCKDGPVFLASEVELS